MAEAMREDGPEGRWGCWVFAAVRVPFGVSRAVQRHPWRPGCPAGGPTTVDWAAGSSRPSGFPPGYPRRCSVTPCSPVCLA
eukprot:9868235-Lingulodinium_polyedra.AAC.2